MRRTLLEQSELNQMFPLLCSRFCPELNEVALVMSTGKLPSKNAFEMVQYSFNDALLRIHNAGIGHGTDNDVRFAAVYYSMFWCFLNSTRKIYKIAEEFGKELLNVEPRIDEKYLLITPDPILIEFTDGVEFQDKEFPNEYYKSALVMLRDIDQDIINNFDKVLDGKFLNGETNTTERQLVITVPVYNKDGTLVKGNISRSYFVNLTKDCDLKDRLIEFLKIQNQESYHLVKYIINSMVYINSGNPDLREYKAPKKPENFKQRERQWTKQNKDKVMVDMTLLGFSYKKATIFGMEKTTVSGHFRWQPYDVGLSKVKLIWIESYEKTFKNFKDSTDTAEQRIV